MHFGEKAYKDWLRRHEEEPLLTALNLSADQLFLISEAQVQQTKRSMWIYLTSNCIGFYMNSIKIFTDILWHAESNCLRNCHGDGRTYTRS